MAVPQEMEKMIARAASKGIDEILADGLAQVPGFTPTVVMTALVTNAIRWHARFGGNRDTLVDLIRDVDLCPEEKAAKQAMDELGGIVMCFGGANPDRSKDND